MRILHVSDIHCANENLRRAMEREAFDLVVASGDFECVDTAELFVSLARDRGVAVTGNLDDPSVARVLRDAGVLIDGRVTSASGATIAGVGGLDVHTSLRRLREWLERDGRVEILVSHHPPRGVLDRTFLMVRIGLREILELVQTMKPRLHLFGHVHEDRGSLESGGVLFVNAGPLKRGYYALVECDEGFERCSIRHGRV